MKHVLLTLTVLLAALTATAHEADNDTAKAVRKVTVKPYGFVRNYLTFDSRKTYTVVGGEYNMQPYDEEWNITQAQADATGLERADLNAVPTTQLQALTTRFGLNISGPGLLGGSSSTGKIEGDFGGFGTNNTVLRLRLAYVRLNWQHTTLLLGQDWHPMSGSMMPNVLGMAAGAPFRPHSRTPQIRYEYHSDKGMELSAALLWQLQYMSNGPSYSNGQWTSVASTSFANNALVPEGFLGIGYRSEHVFMQAGVDVQTLRPRIYGVRTVDSVAYRVPVREIFTTASPTLYCQYTGDAFGLKFRTLYAQNTSHLNQLCGYAVTEARPDGSWRYAPMRASISYLDLSYGKTWRGDLFLGYMKNLGTGTELQNFGTAAKPHYYIFSKGGFTNINSVYRIASSVSYNLKSFNIGLEYEYTVATYGTVGSNGSVLKDERLHPAANHRVCCLVKYNF